MVITTAELVEFINQQPSSRRIDHQRYSTCVFGDFVGEELGLSRSDAGEIAYNAILSSPLKRMLLAAGDSRNFVPSTYGEVQQWIKENDNE